MCTTPAVTATTASTMWVRCHVSYLIFNAARQRAVTTSAITEKIDSESEVGTQRRLKHIGRREQFRLDDEQNDRMRYDQADRYQRNLTVKMVDDVFAPRLGDVAKARREAELQPHHRKAGITERDRELRPEIARRGMRACQEREQGSENEQQIDEDPNGPAQTIKKLHKPILLQWMRSHRAAKSSSIATKSPSKKISAMTSRLKIRRRNRMVHRIGAA